MKYTIFQIDDSRAEKADRIRTAMAKWDEQENVAVDGHNYSYLNLFDKYDGMTEGQAGVWLSFLYALQLTPVVTFDDDAILHPYFPRLADMLIEELPEDADFLSFYVPPAHLHRYRPERHAIDSEWLCRAYQPFGAVAMYYTNKGRDRIRELAQRDGMKMQYDNQLYSYSWGGELNGYTIKPDLAILVMHDDLAPSLVQERDEV